MPLQPNRLYFLPVDGHLVGVRLDYETPDGGALVTVESTRVAGRYLTPKQVATLKPAGHPGPPIRLHKEDDHEVR